MKQDIESGFARLHGAQAALPAAHLVSVECDITRGLHAFTVVGLPDKAVEEAKDRVASAIKNCGDYDFESPKRSNKKIVVSLAPAELKKEGSHYDLAIALAYLAASSEITFDPKGKLFLGELSLDGKLRSIRGTLLLAQAAEKAGFKELFVPEDNANEAALIPGLTVYGAHSLKQVLRHLDKKDPYYISACTRSEGDEPRKESEHRVDLAHIKGQDFAKRALEISAAGKHNLAMWGPPGTGKTMLAQAFTHLLPELYHNEMLEVTGIHSVAGTLRDEIVVLPPLRAPHHTASYPSVIGGGTTPKPGEITLAHRGVLFLKGDSLRCA